ncbi:MAG: hypothetical protein CFE46_00140 [Burkholderiales bacterium PBB6]|jgi:hypothetical protein|uniref:Uncharacterized protein n=1 Tax=Ideonella margarita TaxID=2984191 RepID=A0ABU9C5P4_9BURK|nr:MAG: hypothetical protein CFE46_00140 [Burkholderiales bacterium PBB6]
MTTFALPSGSYRAASLKQVWAGRARAVGHAVWVALEEAGRRRAAVQMLHTAERVAAGQPELAAALRNAATSKR